MRYSIFFIILSAYFLYWINELDSPGRYILLWPLASCIVLSLGYLLNDPFFVLGKGIDGNHSITLLLLNLPWLVITWALWFLVVKAGNEDFLNRIGQTNVFISRRPLRGELTEKYDVIIDLTAEFPRSRNAGQSYFYVPLLDGIAPARCKFPEGLTKDSKILVHCAQGHGRSATYAISLLKKMGYTNSTEDLYNLIKQNRPKVKLSKEQFRYIQNSIF